MNTKTLEKMRKLKFLGMHRAFKISMESGKHEHYTPDEIISHLIDAEWDERQNRNIQVKIKNARFRYKASLEDLSYQVERNIDKNQIMRLMECSFIDRSEKVLITGSTGIGKSFIASAIGHHAGTLGYKSVYYNVPKLFAKLKIAKADGSYLREINKIERQDFLILDDFGIQPFNA